MAVCCISPGLGGISGYFPEKILIMGKSGNVNTAFFTKKCVCGVPICIIYEIFVKFSIFGLIFQKVWHTIGKQANCEDSAVFQRNIEVKKRC